MNEPNRLIYEESPYLKRYHPYTNDGGREGDILLPRLYFSCSGAGLIPT